MLRPAAASVALLLGAVACSSSVQTASQSPTPYPATTSAAAAPIPASPVSVPTVSPASPLHTAGPADLNAVHVTLTRVRYLPTATALAARVGDDRLFVAQRTGEVRAIREGEPGQELILDLTTEVSQVTGGPQGLLGLTFSPDGSRLYVCYTDRAHLIRVVEFAFDGHRVDPATARDLLSVPVPLPGQDTGGGLAFGPDGYLWIAFGDGNFKDPLDNAQSLDSLLGKVLRIDPRPSGQQPYTIPQGNPFSGALGARPEIFAFGFRHPWRFSIDHATGIVWVGDVGQYRREEIDLLDPRTQGGANFGWNRWEGTVPFAGPALPGSVVPLFEYPHTDGRCAVIGGSVYRGTAISGLAGAYVFGDWCDGRIRALVAMDGHVLDVRDLGVSLESLAAFGEGPTGDLYALSQTQGVYRIDPL